MGQRPNAINDANATLIAAAPELFDALADLIKATDFIGSGVADWKRMVEEAGTKGSAVLAKARGEQS